jgi:hypothetical protein
MLIIEGSDYLGKTTAAKRLAEMIHEQWGGDRGNADVYYRHKTKPEPDENTLSWFMRNTGFRIQDRYHLSSIAYGVALGAYEHNPSWAEFRALQRWLRWMGCVTVVFYASDSQKWYKTLEWDATQMYRRDQAELVNEAFKGLAGGYNHGERWCDYAVDVSNGWPDPEQLAEWFDEWRERQR